MIGEDYTVSHHKKLSDQNNKSKEDYAAKQNKTKLINSQFQ
jgi:hypothetical protein